MTDYIDIKLNLEGILAGRAPENARVPRGATLEDLLRILGIAREEVMLAFADGDIAFLSTCLDGKSRVTLSPFICGG